MAHADSPTAPSTSDGDAMTALIETTRPGVRLRQVPVVRDLNITVSEGEVVCLLGANGAGKTTSLLTIAGALPGCPASSR